ncbi:peptidylprolyl isomerase [Ideonella sp. 4Y11]|uniref:Chaperone SurA n=1 Tax=Ideonella aquatica TaxID=2824119 RepID=A0A940YRC7_9BURK|nr:peptidylprolyl isomerase [Ideonella aquatica]MBQ0960578.1 peptidylprolyl isomerase [Ideonella aquatica]
MSKHTTLLSCLTLGLALAFGAAHGQSTRTPARSADYIVAVVNNELVTQIEVDQRLQRLKDDLRRANTAAPPEDELRRQALRDLIDERVQVTWARESGLKADDLEVDRAVANIASANKMTVEQFRARLRDEGMDYQRLRANLRDQLLAERAREREVPGRIKISDSEVENFIEAKRGQAGATQTLNIAQILVSVPDGAAADLVAQRQARADEALRRLRAGESFAAVAREMSDDSAGRERGGELGSRPVDRLPDLFVEAVKPLAVGAVVTAPVRSGAGFHVLKLLERSEAIATATQTRASHILLRPGASLSADAAARRLGELREQIAAGKRRFDEVARSVSEDGSAAQGGDLGWANPGAFVPEFEEVMNRLPVGSLSEPFQSRFGVHLLQVTDRRQVPVDIRQLREQARNALREQKYESAYTEWIDELRARAYIEMREPPQ